MKEHVLSLNNFNMPKVYNGSDAEYILIVRLLLLEPGKIQTHPYMEVGIISRYRYNNEDNFLITLENDIKQQIQTYLPQLVMTNVSLVIKNNILGIIINTSGDNAYVLAYNPDTEKIDTAATYMLDDL